MAYSRYGNLECIQPDLKAPSHGGNTNDSTGKRLHPQVGIHPAPDQKAPSHGGNTNDSTGKRLHPQVGIHPTGNVPLPKRGRNSKSPDVAYKCISPVDVIKTDVGDDNANEDYDDSPRDPHTSMAQTSFFVPKVIPKVNTLGDVTISDIDHKKDDGVVEEKSDIQNKTKKNDLPETGKGCFSLRPLPTFSNVRENISDDTLSNSITMEFTLETPRSTGIIHRAFSSLGHQTRRFGRYIRRRFRQCSVLCTCGDSHVD